MKPTVSFAGFLALALVSVTTPARAAVESMSALLALDEATTDFYVEATPSEEETRIIANELGRDCGKLVPCPIRGPKVYPYFTGGGALMYGLPAGMSARPGLTLNLGIGGGLAAQWKNGSAVFIEGEGAMISHYILLCCTVGAGARFGFELNTSQGRGIYLAGHYFRQVRRVEIVDQANGNYYQDASSTILSGEFGFYDRGDEGTRNRYYLSVGRDVQFKRGVVSVGMRMRLFKDR